MTKVLLKNKGSFKDPNYQFTVVANLSSSKGINIPVWGIVLAVIGGAAISTIFISAITVVYNAPRPGLYQESCEKRSCLKELNLKCINKLCDCSDGYYYKHSCILKKNYMEKCHLTSHCKHNTNLVCRDGVCKCYDFQYWNNKTCSNSSTYNQKCTDSNQCLDHQILYCDIKKSKCLCESNRFWDGSACIFKRSYNEVCNSNSECIDTKSLICSNKTCQCNSSQYWSTIQNACKNKLYEFESCTKTLECNSPMYCSSGKCRCGSNQYYETSVKNCTDQKSNGETCIAAYQCRNDKSLLCNGGICQCNSTNLVWSNGYNTCIVPLSYTSSCFVTTDCDSRKFLICNNATTNCTCPNQLSSGKCDCIKTKNNEYYWNGTICLQAKTFNQTCSGDYMCKTITEGLKCSSSKCICPNLEYFKTANSKCENQLLVDEACPQGDECRSDLNLICQSSICSCNNLTQFWNGSRCVNYYSYNSEICSADSQCKNNLICQTSGSSCNCPNTVPNNKCDCPSPVIGAEYYWNGTECVIAASYNQACLGAYACKGLEQKTNCTSGLCKCGSTGAWNGIECIYCSNGWFFHNNFCYRVGNQVSSITYQSANSSAITAACFNEPDSKLAKIIDSTLEGLFKSKMTLNQNYFIDSFKVSGTSYSSEDLTWSLPSGLGDRCLGFASNDCVIALTYNFFGIGICYKDNSCSSALNVLCEYSLL